MNDIEIIENIIEGDKDCMKAIASQTDNYENDEDYKHFKREVQAIENILKERRADKERIEHVKNFIKNGRLLDSNSYMEDGIAECFQEILELLGDDNNVSRMDGIHTSN